MNHAARRQAGDPVRRRLGLVVHDPVVVILALISFFSAISGQPLDALLIMLVAVAGRMPLAGVAAWGAVLGAGGLWELWALLQQPSLTVTSYAHPTISALTDPVLATPPGRAIALIGWLLLGWYLIR